MLRMVGNFIWFILAGFWLGLTWWILGVLMFVFIVTIPWGKAAFVLGQFSFLPFGRTVIKRSELSGEKDIGTGALGLIGNVIWFLLAGIWLAIVNIFYGVLCFITIIGIPFGVQCFKLAGASLFPIGKTVVTNAVAEAAIKANAEKVVEDARSDK
ncbi:MAG: YccF domain-containing protein [Pseudomonadota bacterium]|nr:YccF domain-containing protein [Pseudomonadota bacterium]